jgi:hypothetical protein
VTAPTSWEALLQSPCAGDHIVQLYADEAFFTRAVSGFIGAGLAAGEGAVVIATRPHVDALVVRLAAAVDVAGAVALQQLVVADADATLARLTARGRLDDTIFTSLVDGIFDRMQRAGYESVRLFGEMVDRLRVRDLAATIELERLWNEALTGRRASLLCAYRADNFDRHAHRGLVRKVSRVHTHLIPVEDYGRLEWAVDRAYRDVFGGPGEARSLRELLVAHYPASLAMPPAQAALHALRAMKASVADEVLERAGWYYAGGALAGA